MTVQAKIRKIGNSSGIILNSTILEHLEAKAGDNLELILNDNSVILKKPNKRGAQ